MKSKKHQSQPSSKLVKKVFAVTQHTVTTNSEILKTESNQSTR